MTASHFRLSIWWVLVLALIGVGVVRIVLTYRVFDQTIDEPAHIAAGIELLERRSWTIDPLGTPLPRVAVAIGPFLAGVRLADASSLPALSRLDTMFQTGNATLRSGDRYDLTLQLARGGTLIFFVAACVLVALWSRSVLGPSPALVAVLLFSTLPPILAHSGLATTDMSITVCLPAVVLALVRWRGKPGGWSATVLGAAVATAILAKLSALLFIPACTAAVFVVDRVLRSEEFPLPLPNRSRLWILIAAMMLAGGLLLWGGYGFTVGTITDVAPGITDHIEGTFGPSGSTSSAAQRLARLEIVPAPGFFTGVKNLLYLNRVGRKTFLLGEVYPNGHPAFFPVAMAVKLPLAFLVLVAVGIAETFRRVHAGSKGLAIPLACAIAILAAVIPTQINIGFRHILPITPFLAVIAAAGSVALAQVGRAGRASLVLLLVWHVLSGAVAHPDYLAYFNELSGFTTRPMLLDSDLDWAQDVKRLRSELARRGIESPYVSLHGERYLGSKAVAGARELPPYQPVTGWISISELRLWMGYAGDSRSDGYAWLRSHTPVARIGRSILLYHITPPDSWSRVRLLSTVELWGSMH